MTTTICLLAVHEFCSEQLVIRLILVLDILLIKRNKTTLEEKDNAILRLQDDLDTNKLPTSPQTNRQPKSTRVEVRPRVQQVQQVQETQNKSKISSNLNLDDSDDDFLKPDDDLFDDMDDYTPTTKGLFILLFHCSSIVSFIHTIDHSFFVYLINLFYYFSLL